MATLSVPVKDEIPCLPATAEPVALTTVAAGSSVTTVAINGHRFHAASNIVPQFWEEMAAGTWEPATLKLFDRFVDSQTVFFDIGTWMGPTTMYAARSARQIYSFEPDPIAFSELSHNLQLNAGSDWVRRIQPHNMAVARENGTMRLGVQDCLGKSTNSLLLSDQPQGVSVETIAFDALADFPGLDGSRIFVKMDIEGGEYDLLTQPSRLLARRECMLFLSLHPKMLLHRINAQAPGGRAGWIARRRQFAQTCRQIVETLPFSHYYTTTGRPLAMNLQLFRALALGKFKREIVGMHRPWDAM
jgi:FkbM family methyltransferase